MGLQLMCNSEKYIWLFGENNGRTANNNSFWMWKFIVDYHNDLNAFFIAEKTAQTKAVYSRLTQKEKRLWVWRNSLQHARLYDMADMLFVSLSFRDVQPDSLFGKSYKPLTTQPLIYLQHGTLAIKVLGYENTYSNNCMFRFIYYNPKISEQLEMVNGFKKYQLYNGIFLPRYMELMRRHLAKERNNGKVFLWFFTWREYLSSEQERNQFTKRISLLLRDQELNRYLLETNSKIRICLHPQMCASEIECMREAVHGKATFEFVPSDSVDVMQELVDADVLITDYSSVGFDFTAMNKPVILYFPDLRQYLEEREIYCTLEELCAAGFQRQSDLVNCIVQGNYGINSFFRSRMPETIDPEQIAQGRYIERMYQYFWQLQQNTIAFLGYDFSGIGGTVFATRALAEGLLEQGYLVRGFTLKQIKEWKCPAGMALKPMTHQYSRRLIDKVLERVFFLKRHYRYLDMDPAKQAMKPLAGLNMTRLMKDIHAGTVISTRESLHFFLNESQSPFIQKKIYFFHAPAGLVDQWFPTALEKLNAMNLKNVVFVSENNRLALMEKSGYTNYQNYAVIGNALDSSRSIPPERVAPSAPSEVMHGICLMRLSVERKTEADEIIAFGRYMKENDINDITLDVFGGGDYFKTFVDMIEVNKIQDYICAKGATDSISMEFQRHDFCVDFSRNQSFGMASIESFLNGRMIFTYPNEGACEVLSDIPDCLFETYPQLIQKIRGLREMTQETMLYYYSLINRRYGREVVTKRFMRLLDHPYATDDMNKPGVKNESLVL